LWDNDKEGRNSKKKAKEYFGQKESSKHFFLNPLKSKNSKKTILQDLFDDEDIRSI